MAVKTISISMDERTYRQAKAAAELAGLHAWAAWAEASEKDFPHPEAGKGAA